MNPTRRLFMLAVLGLASAAGVVLAVPRKYLRKFLVEAENLLTSRPKISTEQNAQIFVAKNGSPNKMLPKSWK